jgi:hypothetical protein
MYVQKGGELYGFCPAKSTWDGQTGHLFRILKIASETGAMWSDGPLSEQPEWFIDVLSWFLTKHDFAKFQTKARMVLGDGKKESSAPKTPRKK